MAKSQTNYATNASNNLMNQAQGLTGPLLSGFQSAINQQTSNEGDIYNSLTGGIANQQATGGYDPSQLGKLQGNYGDVFSSAGNIASTGGYDPTQLSAINAGYGGLAMGGFTPGQEQDFIRQATSGVKGTYDTLEEQTQRDRAKTGGLGTG